MKKLNVALSIAAGLLGGVVSHFVWTQPVHAQVQSTSPAPQEIRSQSFVLVDAKGNIQGIFSFGENKDGYPIIKLLDGQGRQIWTAGGSGLLTLSTNSK